LALFGSGLISGRVTGGQGSGEEDKMEKMKVKREKDGELSAK